ncbi:MAG: hypothetical protein ICV53_13355 [Flavisolibacter sp.]|nr:hypothetical protein [Flavisolibacter sp.]
MEENKNKVTEEVKEGGIGRAPSASQQEEGQKFGGSATGNPKEKKERDISDIDQQEGSMNNGMLGGNFNEEENRNR